MKLYFLNIISNDEVRTPINHNKWEGPNIVWTNDIHKIRWLYALILMDEWDQKVLSMKLYKVKTSTGEFSLNIHRNQVLPSTTK